MEWRPIWTGAALSLASGCWILAGTEDFTDQGPVGGNAATTGHGGEATSSSAAGGAGGSSSAGGASAGGASAGGASATSGSGGAVPGKVVFVTAEVQAGVDFTNVSEATAICNATARSAGLSGEFTAWLSAAGDQAIDRLNKGRFVRLDNMQVFASKVDIPLGATASISVEASGAAATTANANISVYTATNSDGSFSTFDCGGWTNSSENVTLGDWTATGLTWTQTNVANYCSSPARLYCFEL